MRKSLLALLSLLIVLSLASSAAAVSSPFLASPAARTVLVNLIGADGKPLPNAEIHLLTPGVTTMVVARTDSRGQATLKVPDGFSFWIRVWADGYGLIERPYVPASDGPVLTLRATSYTTLLTGLVTDDQGLPIAEAQVSLFREGYGLESSAMTNELGLYTMKAVRADGAYTLQVEARGFRPVSQDLTPLSANSRNQADVSLTPATGAVTGEVVDASNSRPVSGVRVELLLNDWGVVDTTTTDSTGYFYLPAPPVANGLYQIRLSRPDFETSTSGGFAVNPGGWNDFSGANRLTVNRLYAQISGKVTDQSAAALSTIEVHLQREGLGTVEVAVTDAAGKFRFNQVTNGTYRVRAFPNGDASRSASGWLTVAGGQDVTANIIVESPNRTSYGFESLSGKVKNHLGDPVAGATVQVHRGMDVYTAQTDGEGRYDVEVEATIPNDPTEDDDPATGYHVIVSASGYLTNDQPQTENGQAPSLVTIRNDADNQANFVLQPETATIAGRVLNHRGQFMAGVKVGLLQEGKHVVAETTTDPTGSYRFPHLPFAKQGRYIPVVLDPAYIQGPITPAGAPVEPTSLSPVNPSRIMLVARPSVSIIQGLVQAGDAQPAEGAVVTVSRTTDGRTFAADVRPDGSYQVRVPAVPGEQYLVRAAVHGATDNAAAAVTALETSFGALVNLTMHPTAGVTGRVYGPDGRPVEGVRVMLYAEGSTIAVKSTSTDATGAYRFAELKPGRRYAVIASDGLSQLSALAPGEVIISPLIGLPSGETLWADLKINVVPVFVNP